MTICTHDRKPLFGRFFGDDLVLNRFAGIVREVWCAIPDHFATAVTDTFVIMPNHVHGIVWIQRAPDVGPVTHVGPHHDAPLRREIAPAPVLLPASLGAIVLQFKSAAVKRINTLRRTPGAPVWQRNYYDRIIRDDRELDAAREYILDNPRKWSQDKHNPTVFRKQP